MKNRPLIPAAIFALALVLRLVYLFQINASSPFIENEVGDSTIYIAQAEEVLRGDFLAGKEAFFHSSPVYIYFLAAIFSIFGKSLFAVRMVQTVIGSVSCVLLYFIAKKYFGRRTGIITGVMAALYGFFIFSDADVLAINLVIFFILGSFLALVHGQEKGSPWLIALSGILLGLSALGKPDMLLLSPVIFFWLFFTTRKREDLRSRPLILCIVLFLSVSAVVLPVTVRNYLVQKDLVLITSNAGINLYIGNNAEASGMFGVPQGKKIFNDHRFYRSTFTWPEQQTGHTMLPSEVSRFWFQQGLDFMKGHPWEELKLLGLKFLLFWNWYEIPNHHDYYYAKEFFSSLLKMPFIVGFAFMVPLALCGLVLCLSSGSRRERPSLFPLGAFIVVPMLTTITFFVTARYRLPAVTFLFPFAGYALSRLYDAAREVDSRPSLVRTAAVLVVAAALVNVRLPDFNTALGIANEHDDVASLYYKQENYQKAAGIYERAVTYHHNEAYLYYKLGGIYRVKLNDPQKAYAAFRRSAELAPENIDAALNLGATALETGRIDEAEREFRKILELEPDYVKALVNLGAVYNQTGRPREAVSLLERALRKEPANFNALTNLGYSYLLLKDWRSAVFYQEAALRIDPSSAIARLDLVEALVGLGEKGKAREQLLEILQNAPPADPMRRRAEEALASLR